MAECRYLCSPDILAAPDSTQYTVKIDFSTVEGDVVRAGTPLSRDGKVANDATAFGILLRDTWRQSPYAKICIDGLIDFALAQEHSGVTLSAEAKAVMRNIRFVGDPECTTGGSGGGETPSDFSGKWEDLEGRPFYDNITADYYLESTELTEDRTTFSTPDGSRFELSYREEYIINFDGVEYTAKNIQYYSDYAYDSDDKTDFYATYVYGNADKFDQYDPYFSGYNSSPFIIWGASTTGEYHIEPIPRNGATHTVSIYKNKTGELKTLPPKFLPPEVVTEDELEGLLPEKTIYYSDGSRLYFDDEYAEELTMGDFPEDITKFMILDVSEDTPSNRYPLFSENHIEYGYIGMLTSSGYKTLTIGTNPE